MRVADLLPCEILDLFPYDGDASFVTGVQFEDARLVELWSIELAKSA